MTTTQRRWQGQLIDYSKTSAGFKRLVVGFTPWTQTPSPWIGGAAGSSWWLSWKPRMRSWSPSVSVKHGVVEEVMVSNLHKEVLNSAEMCCYCRMKLPERTTIAGDLRTDWWAACWCWCFLHLRFVIDEKQAECTHLKRRTSLKERLPILKPSFEKSWQQFTTFCLYLLIDFVGLAMKGGGWMSFGFQEN